MIVKRFLDLFISMIILVPFSVALIIIGTAIKINSKGKVFFKQKRLGMNGKEFYIYKFRTMIENAEQVGSGIYTSETDPRITKVGHFLRKTSLDELPQIINILKGDMSFVGPRPPVPYHPRKYENYDGIQKIRFKVRPGVTGLAQIKGRNHLTWDERIETDVEYVQNWSIWTDIEIIWKTIFSVFKSENIYRKREDYGDKP